MPNSAGVLVATCPDGHKVGGKYGDYDFIDAKDCDDIRATFAEKSTGWATHCHGPRFPIYWIFVSDDPALRQRMLEKVVRA